MNEKEKDLQMRGTRLLQGNGGLTESVLMTTREAGREKHPHFTNEDVETQMI